MDDITLLECPFCGSDEADFCACDGRHGWFTWVECSFCGARSKTFKYYDNGDEYINLGDPGVKKAARSWNRRP